MNKYRSPQRPKKSSMIGGAIAIMDALREGQQLERIYVDTRTTADGKELINLAGKSGVPVNYVPAAKLNSFNLINHGGYIAFIAKVQYLELQDVIDLAVNNGETPLFLILDGITDIRNIGGIARTAYCCGIHAIIIPDKGVGALNEDAIGTSAGALEKIAVCRVNSLMKTVDTLHLNGIMVYATEMTASKTIHECDLRLPSAIIMGSEDNGIYPALMKICDEQIRIPMQRNFESLNVSVATGIIVYEAMRQRVGAAINK